MFQGWKAVGQRLAAYADDPEGHGLVLNAGQRASLAALAVRLHSHGAIIADEVGMGKTRIAAVAIKAVVDAGGRAAVAIPAGLGPQWQAELSNVGQTAERVLRSLAGYLDAWGDGLDSAHIPTPTEPWADQSIVLVSHRLCNWSLGAKTRKNWRWALLPATLALHAAASGRMPRDTVDRIAECDSRVRAAATWIAANRASALQQLLDNSPGLAVWGKNSPLFLGDSYSKDSPARVALERLVGLGLGTFDFIVIDEAHKSRGDSTGLGRLLGGVLAESATARRLAVTATPIELGAIQWREALARVQIVLPGVDEVIDRYGKAVQDIRRAPHDDERLRVFAQASLDFTRALSPYVLRRDKREDPYVRRFGQYSGKPAGAYRRRLNIDVRTAEQTDVWKHAICGAESLSLVLAGEPQEAAKRLRLTFANGHGVSSVLATAQGEDEADAEVENTADEKLPVTSVSTVPRDAKLAARLAWWKSVAMKPFAAHADQHPLFTHPAILAVANAIDETVAGDEGKVLVFGRFTRPLQALRLLLNARQLLRAKATGQAWPHAKIHDESLDGEEDNRLTEWGAIRAAHSQLGYPGEPDRRDIDQWLTRNMVGQERMRRESREHLLARLEIGLAELQSSCNMTAAYGWRVFTPFAQACRHEAAQRGDLLGLMTRAVQEIEPKADADPSALALAFCEVVRALGDQDALEGEAEADDITGSQWSVIRKNLEAEYRSPKSDYARLMNGDTKPHARRLLQLAFNRHQSAVKVLIAQSTVGREGLNLHEACRVVVLLHAEWNPGVVEQQIGRVDRLGSLWERQLDTAIAAGETDLPTITYRPVIFEGTYDEHHWQVLGRRWGALRAQLHGVVLGEEQRGCPTDRVRKVNRLAPDFSPLWR